MAGQRQFPLKVLGQQYGMLQRRPSNDSANNDSQSQLKVNKLIMDEAKKLVEFDHVPQASLLKVLESFPKTELLSSVSMEDDGFFSLEDVQMSSKSLKEKVDLCEREMRRNPTNNQASSKASLSGGDFRKKTFQTYETTLDSVKLTLWNATLWKIQGKFGLTTASFFSFMRWITLLNLFNSVVVLSLVMVPHVSFLSLTESNDTSNGAQCLSRQYKNVSFYPLGTGTNSFCCSKEYEGKAAPLEFDWASFWPDLSTFLVSLLTGTNWVESSTMFYGHYSGTFKFAFENVDFDFPLAYFLVIFVVFVVNLSVIVASSATSLKRRIKLSIFKEDGNMRLFSIVFGSWVHKIRDKETVATQKSDILGRIKATLSNLNRKQRRAQLSLQERRKLTAIRVLINMLILGILAGIGSLIFWVTSVKAPQLMVSENCANSNFEGIDSSHLISDIKCVMIEYLPSIVVTLANISIPFFFTIIIEYEGYDANTKLLLNLARCIFLRLASLLITLISLVSKVNCNYARGCFHQGNFSLSEMCGNNGIAYQACSNVNLKEEAECEKPLCWETYVGQQFYKLTLVDLIVQVIIVFLIDGPRRLLIGHCLKGNKSLESFRNYFGVIQFNLTKHVLDIVYSQTICWLAIFYAPLITVVTMAKFIFVYYLRIFYITFICSPASVPYTATRASEFFKFCLLFAFAGSTVATAFFISTVTPSTACGPFRNVSCIIEDELTGNGTWTQNCLVYDYVVTLIDESGSLELKNFLFLVGQSTVLYSICGFFVLVSYLFFALSNADARLSKELKIECSHERAENEKKYEVLRDQLKLLRQAMMLGAGEGASSSSREKYVLA